MSVRDKVLPAINKAGAIVDALGFKRTTLKIRQRTWSGTKLGDTGGQSPGYADVDLTITPRPRVSMVPPYETQMAGLMQSGGSPEDRYFKLEGLVPQFTDPADNTVKGYTPGQLRPSVAPGVRNVEIIYVLIGDDGQERACTLVASDFTQPFKYELTLRLRTRDDR